MADAGEAIARYLRERREAAGMTRATLGRAANMSPALIQKIEQGTRTPTQDALAALFEALEVPLALREHIVGLLSPVRLGSKPAMEAEPPAAAAISVIESMTHPACIQLIPSWDVIAANAAFTRLFPGLEAGGNILEWMVLHPLAKTLLAEWWKQTHLLVYSFRIMGPGMVAPERIAQIVESCSGAPEWELLWTTEVAPQDIPRWTVLLNDPDTGRRYEMYTNSLKFEMPRNNWWIYSLTPAG